MLVYGKKKTTQYCNYPSIKNKLKNLKINTQKSLAFLYTNNEKSEREIKQSIPFTTATKRTKHLGKSLPNETKDLDAENCKMLMKEIKDDTNRWRDIPGLEESMKMTILTQSNLQIQCNPYQITKGIFSQN